MDHATSLSQVQRANLNLLLLMRDAAMRDMGDAVVAALSGKTITTITKG